jgi:hypothetical protein
MGKEDIEISNNEYTFTKLVCEGKDKDRGRG